MPDAVRPRLVISRCLLSEDCRWNSEIIRSPAALRLLEHVDVAAAPCPEVEIGLGVPRKPIRIVERGGELLLLQSESERDLSEAMRARVGALLEELHDVDGFLLKHRSPTCGPRGVKVYPGLGKVGAQRSDAVGFLAGPLQERFPLHPVEDEGRLRSFAIRHHFLVRLFTLARWRRLCADATTARLQRFHAQHKYLLMAYHQTRLRELGRVVATASQRPLPEALADYELGLRQALQRAPRRGSDVNVMMHLLGGFSERLSPPERAFVLQMLDGYTEGRVPLSVPLSILKAHTVRYDIDYLHQTVFFEPYPPALVEISDSGKGRDL